jgi:hypothetical protein
MPIGKRHDQHNKMLADKIVMQCINFVKRKSIFLTKCSNKLFLYNKLYIFINAITNEEEGCYDVEKPRWIG